MNKLLKTRATRTSRLPTAMLMLALVAGFASVGQTQDIPQMVITAERPADCETFGDLRDQMQATARRVVWKTQARVGADLNVKLNSRNGWVRLAGADNRKRC